MVKSAKSTSTGTREITEFKGEVIETVRHEYVDGTVLSGPYAPRALKPSQVSIGAGDIIDIACKIFPDLCGGGGDTDGGGGGGKGCYTIITPDGTRITICPPNAVIA